MCYVEKYVLWEVLWFLCTFVKLLLLSQPCTISNASNSGTDLLPSSSSFPPPQTSLWIFQHHVSFAWETGILEGNWKKKFLKPIQQSRQSTLVNLVRGAPGCAIMAWKSLIHSSNFSWGGINVKTHFIWLLHIKYQRAACSCLLFKCSSVSESQLGLSKK